MEGKGFGGSKQTPAKNPDAPVTKGELGNEIKKIMSEHLPTIVAQSQENFRKAEEARKATEEAEKKKKANEEAERRRKAMEDKRAAEEQERKRTAEQDRKNAEDAQRLRNEEAERRMVKYASHLLQGEARHWWDMIKITRGDDVASVMTWEEFEDLVMENYCPQGLMDKLEEEFLKLQQNDMTVLKYTAKFNEKARFLKYQENNRQLEEGGDNKRKRENHDDDMKKIKIIGEKTDNPSEKADWVCFRCKKPGHKIVDCPERSQDPQEKTGYSGNRVEYKDTQPRKTMGRVFQLTAEKAQDTPY
ncbi:zinc finger, CCHC-type, retrotransposon gag domain protein [Tanacetum coccineum]